VLLLLRLFTLGDSNVTKGKKMAARSKRRPTRQQAMKAIDELDLVHIEDKAMKIYRWGRPRVRAADLWYRNFLRLCYDHGSPLAAIGKDADDLWHLHILDTPKYTRDCDEIFGSYLSHQPVYGRPSANDRKIFKDSEKVYVAAYGELPASPTIVSFHPPKEDWP
jgi:hypothetical protein